MRAIVAHPGPHFSVADCYTGWVSGLKANGVAVQEFNLQDRLGFYAEARMPRGDELVKAFSRDAAVQMAAEGLLNACFKWWPDFVLVVSGFFVNDDYMDMLRDRGIRVVLLHTESPYEDDRQAKRAEHASLNLINDPTNLDRFPTGTIYVPHGYDPQLHKPGPRDPRCASDFAFCGTGFPSRTEFFENVDWRGADVAFAGNWQHLSGDSPLFPFLAHPPEVCCPNDETVRLYQSTKASANLYRKESSHNADGWAIGPREVELAATGTFFLREPRGEGDDLFPHLPTFTTPDEFSDLLAYWLEHDNARTDAAAKAREAITDRTFTNHAAELLRLFDK